MKPATPNTKRTTINYVNQQAPYTTIIGFDFGQRRIGVAIGQPITGTASPLTTIENNNNGVNWAALTDLIREWKPDAIVVGLPLHKDGSDSPSTKAARKFAKELQQRFALPVYMHDESLTSSSAKSLIREQHQQGLRSQKNHKQDIDKLAASFILESWLLSTYHQSH